MPFTVDEFHDLIRILEERPEWRAELRRLTLTEELLNLPQAVQALLEVQRRSEERLAGVEERLARIEEQIAALAEAQRRSEERLAGVEERLAGVEERLARTEENIAALAEAQRRSEQRLERIGDDVGKLKGYILEERYRNRPHVNFRQLVRRAHTLSGKEMAELLEPAVQQGPLAEAAAEEILLSDAVVWGLRRPDNVPVYLVVEVSWGIGREDVARAATRAALLAAADVPAMPVAAGDWATPEAQAEAKAVAVWLVTDGHATPPDG